MAWLRSSLRSGKKPSTTTKGAICANFVSEPHVAYGSTVPEFAVTVTDPEDLGPDQNLMVNLNKVPKRIKSVVE